MQQTYRHLVQQHIVQRGGAPQSAAQDTESEAQTRGVAWEVGGILALGHLG